MESPNVIWVGVQLRKQMCECVGLWLWYVRMGLLYLIVEGHATAHVR